MGILLTLKKSKPWSYTELVICKTTVHKSVYLYVISRTDHMTVLQWDDDSDGITTWKSFHEIWQRSHNYATSNCKDPLLVLVRSAHFTHRYRSGRASHSGPTITIQDGTDTVPVTTQPTVLNQWRQSEKQTFTNMTQGLLTSLCPVLWTRVNSRFSSYSWINCRRRFINI